MWMLITLSFTWLYNIISKIESTDSLIDCIELSIVLTLFWNRATSFIEKKFFHLMEVSQRNKWLRFYLKNMQHKRIHSSLIF